MTIGSQPISVMQNIQNVQSIQNTSNVQNGRDGKDVQNTQDMQRSQSLQKAQEVSSIGSQDTRSSADPGNSRRVQATDNRRLEDNRQRMSANSNTDSRRQSLSGNNISGDTNNTGNSRGISANGTDRRQRTPGNGNLADNPNSIIQSASQQSLDAKNDPSAKFVRSVGAPVSLTAERVGRPILVSSDGRVYEIMKPTGAAITAEDPNSPAAQRRMASNSNGSTQQGSSSVNPTGTPSINDSSQTLGRAADMSNGVVQNASARAQSLAAAPGSEVVNGSAPTNVSSGINTPSVANSAANEAAMQDKTDKLTQYSKNQLKDLMNRGQITQAQYDRELTRRGEDTSSAGSSSETPDSTTNTGNNTPNANTAATNPAAQNMVQSGLTTGEMMGIAASSTGAPQQLDQLMSDYKTPDGIPKVQMAGGA